MIRPAAVVVSFLLLSPVAFSQKSESDPQTMQAVLSGIRQLRHDLQTAAFAARRAQIVIYQLHEETAAAEQASEKLENTKTTLAPVHAQAEFQATQIKGLEEYRDSVANDQQRKQVDDSLTRRREQVDAWVAQEQELTGIVSEPEAEFRADQAKMERFENELDELDRDRAQTAEANNR